MRNTFSLLSLCEASLLYLLSVRKSNRSVGEGQNACENNASNLGPARAGQIWAYMIPYGPLSDHYGPILKLHCTHMAQMMCSLSFFDNPKNINLS